MLTSIRGLGIGAPPGTVELARIRTACPPPGMVIRINTVVECMDECSLVGPAYQGSPCTFGIFMGTQQDENCLLFTTDIHWTMEEYLDT